MTEVSDYEDCGCGKCCLPTIVAERDEAEAREKAARADLARAILLLRCITETPTPIPGVTLGDYHEHVAAFLAETGKR